MSKFLNPLSLVGGPIMIFISCMAFWSTTLKKNIINAKIIVDIEILNPPISCENITKKGLPLKLRYNNKIFIERINQKKCSQILGQTTLQMLSDKEGDYFIFEDDYQSYHFIYPLLFFGFGIFCIFKGAHEKKKKNKQ